jgi:hypothetical protein
VGVESFGFQGLVIVDGKVPDLAVGKDAVDVKEDEPDAAGALDGRELDSTIHIP